MDGEGNHSGPPAGDGWSKLKLPGFRILLAAVGLAVLFLALGVYLAVRLSHVDSRLTEVDRRLGRTAELVTEMGEQARQAAERASEAERNSRLSNEGRRQAEAERDAAVWVASEARDEAAEARTEADAAKHEAEEIRRQRDQELNRLQSNLNRIAETRRTALGLVMNLGSDALQFDFDKSDLRPQSRELLSRILGILLTLDKGYAVYVYGHTDDIGSHEYNMELSLRRADSVRDYLVEGGIDSSIVTTRGFGKTRPLVDAGTPEARAKNRRVELGIIQTDIRFENALPSQ